jgi:MFS transporter, NNP family, nitrate/nitrite transporter
MARWSAFVLSCPRYSGRENAVNGRQTQHTILTLSTTFTLPFAAWLMFDVLCIPIRKEFGPTEVQFGWLTAIAVFNGTIWHLLFGLWTDRSGGHRVLAFLVALTAIPAFLVNRASSFNELLAYAFLVGMAANAFSIENAWNSAWFPRKRQGFALGVFGAGSVGGPSYDASGHTAPAAPVRRGNLTA